MLFNSIAFAVFLPIVFVLYWLAARNFKIQNVILLVASYVFYAWWDWRYLFLIAGCSAVNFLAGGWIYKAHGAWTRRALLALCCLACLGTLCVFKYFNFFTDSFARLFACIGIHWSPWVLNLALPVGISFFTFQALSYTIDIALGRMKPTHNLIDFFVFISFFPQLVAGPIERASNLLPQFQKPRAFDFDAATHGVCLVAYGLFKKMVVADTLSLYVDKVFGDPMFYTSTTCLIGALFFSVQIYCDFSGYSDVARGVARLFGFELMLNFDRPYLSRSFSEFWRHWHISLSSWFKDYVYIPLGGNRVPFPRLLCNLWIVFLLSGLWHGASWAFVAWGALHALYLSIGAIRAKLLKTIHLDVHKLPSLFQIFIVNVGVVFAWIFFRAGTLDNAVVYLNALFRCQFKSTLMALCAGTGPMHFAFCGIAVLLLASSYLLPRDCRMVSLKGRMLFSVSCIAAIVFLGMPSGGEFIYFRF